MSEPTSESVWSLRADELLRRTASPEPTPGNGSIAPVSGALGIGLVLMALAITDEPPAALRERGDALLSSVVATADRDVAVFRAVLDARGMPERDEAERAARGDAIERATLTAAEVPLDLATALRDALELAADAEPLVKPALVSDVRAGADIIAGAARAALRATELNLEVLERSGSAAARSLRARHDALVSALQRR
ncbi:Formiminotetrahydrofolate cyclodeaminase [Agrococcus baldri]|uniref:Formiminotetrahydrofolate cyclodeaminase n=1 Tax=Agrococcus baldri TaxID=153730 RepID=A0AA94HPI0_9MICO|nr:cyclodeaminase/cyclohydrolase family protein [Agrococcus baldri]SFS17947.1 Formiminotetrahydrofolate cyclodeaminase [Agrococcus baldri]